MNATARQEQRTQAIQSTVARIRAIEAEQGMTPASLERIKQTLLELAARQDLFPLSDFPLPAPGAERNNALYRLSEDPDHRYALYAQVSRGGTDTPAHNHTTWAVIVGLQGEELNRLYDHDGKGGVKERETFMVTRGTGIAFMPDDLHSIHMVPEKPVLNFHMYGLALEQLTERRYYKPATHDWAHFPASAGIRDLPQPA
ncbi:MAG TPA: cysteine dioxygenase [Burkholderiaceae bacterium]|jgi:predicted metal-dependent enzyme (double-stranded beta helix superfamily)|nr:cysteine dioxygenase [Burkholderiaceae bacterium]